MYLKSVALQDFKKKKRKKEKNEKVHCDFISKRRSTLKW